MRNATGIARLFEIAGERKGLLVLSGVLSAVSAVLTLVPYIAVYCILAELLGSGDDLASVNATAMKRWGITALGGFVAGLVFLYLSAMASHVAAFRILYRLRVRLAEHIGTLHLGYLTRTSTGAVKKTLEQNVEKIEQFIAHQIPDLVNVLATVVIMFVAMAGLNGWMMVACVVAVLVGFSLQASMMVGEKADMMMKGYYDALERINASAIQYVRGMPAVKVFGQTVFSFRRFYDDLVGYSDLVTRWADEFQTGFVLFKTVLASFLSFVLPVGVLLLSRDPESVSLALVVLFFVIMAPGVAAPLYKLMYLSSSLRDISEGVERIDAVFSEAPSKQPARPRAPERYDVEFDDVSFSYEVAEEPTGVEALRHISFHAEQGAVTALVGPSGSGKSTVANLIPRFWDVQSGNIRIGGVDIREMSTEGLMDTVSFVFQDTFMFYDSVYENILVGRPDATPPEVYAAARAAQCHDFIQKLPNGYYTLIGEGGVYLSGGEEQRVSVARAILNDAPVLVLDEATAFADPENEHKMQLAINELMRDKTVIVIAHRLSSIQAADNIVVLADGRVSETGRHEELLSNRGLYRRMWDRYTDASAWSFRSEGAI